MRLIDADILIKNLSYLYTKNHIPVDTRAKEILTTIMEQPTAYDVDNVIEEVNKLESNHVSDWSTIKTTLKEDLRDYIFEKTKRNPMILPIIMEV